jgi:hypothetical protein
MIDSRLLTADQLGIRLEVVNGLSIGVEIALQCGCVVAV